MDFTREPIIETIISPREGHKLLIRNTKGEKTEEYCIDAVEVVSFGRAFFFRSSEKPKAFLASAGEEKPKAFLVPTGDYEVVEVRETRIALKSVSHERSIKIGGGRENTRASAKEAPVLEEEVAAVEESSILETVESTTEEVRTDKRRDRHRRRRRRHVDEQQERPRKTESSEKELNELKEKGTEEEKPPSPMLIPPPPVLISETLLSRYKDKDLGQPLPVKQEEVITHEEILEQPVEPKVEEKKEDQESNSDGTTFSRSLVSPPAFVENINSDFLF